MEEKQSSLAGERVKVILLVFDGLGDRPIKELGGKTPLEAAQKPNLNKLAEEGITGLVDTCGRGVRGGSDTSHLALFGYDPQKYYTGRGPFEAAGLGMILKPGDIAFRANFATIDSKFTVQDRRAGRIDSGKVFEQALNGIKLAGAQVLFKAGVEHRGALVLRGKNLSAEISSTDPHEVGAKVLESKPLEKSKEAKKTAELVNDFTRKSFKTLESHSMNKERAKRKLLPANVVLVRGAGVVPTIPPFKEQFGLSAACVAGGGMYKGIARLVGMDVIEVKGATGTAQTDIAAKFNAAKKALEKNDFVFVHLKATDNFAHDGNAVGKKEFIEKADSFIPILSSVKNALIIVTGDHSTPCAVMNHSADPNPILFRGEGARGDDVKEFGERACAKGGAGRMKGTDLMNEVLNLLGKLEIYGA
jgi:2,3-bisphosphoglycerate-independent phosphoglycerate mutase